VCCHIDGRADEEPITRAIHDESVRLHVQQTPIGVPHGRDKSCFGGFAGVQHSADGIVLVDGHDPRHGIESEDLLPRVPEGFRESLVHISKTSIADAVNGHGRLLQVHTQQFQFFGKGSVGHSFTRSIGVAAHNSRMHRHPSATVANASDPFVGLRPTSAA
jgi:hypothetical protein